MRLCARAAPPKDRSGSHALGPRLVATPRAVARWRARARARMRLGARDLGGAIVRSKVGSHVAPPSGRCRLGTQARATGGRERRHNDIARMRERTLLLRSIGKHTYVQHISALGNKCYDRHGKPARADVLLEDVQGPAA